MLSNRLFIGLLLTHLFLVFLKDMLAAEASFGAAVLGSCPKSSLKT